MSCCPLHIRSDYNRNHSLREDRTRSFSWASRARRQRIGSGFRWNTRVAQSLGHFFFVSNGNYKVVGRHVRDDADRALAGAVDTGHRVMPISRGHNRTNAFAERMLRLKTT